MDSIRFTVEDYVDPEGRYRIPNINIYANNRNLIDLVSKIEQRRSAPEWKNKRSPYIGFHVKAYDHFRLEMLAQHERPASILLTCTCMEPMCSCIMADVSVQSELVFWSDIHHPYFSSKDPWARWLGEHESTYKWKPIDYSELGTFVFRRKQYFDALDALARH